MNRNKPLFLLPLLLISCSLSAAEAESDLQERMSKLEKMVDNRGLLNILNEMESLQQEVRELRGEIEQQAYTIDQMKRQQQDLYDEQDQLQQRMPGEESVQPAEMSKNADENIDPDPVMLVETPAEKKQRFREGPEGSSTAEKPSIQPSAIQPVESYVAKPHEEDSVSEIPEDPQSDTPQAAPEIAADSSEETSYSEAFGLLKQGKQDKAIDNFRAFLDQYPDSQYADNAQYWLGEAFYVKREFKFAVNEYKSLLENYPDSGKASHAQLKIGYCYDELGQKDLAQGELEDLIARYPGTSAATLAEERLNQIRSQ